MAHFNSFELSRGLHNYEFILLHFDSGLSLCVDIQLSRRRSLSYHSDCNWTKLLLEVYCFSVKMSHDDARVLSNEFNPYALRAEYKTCELS